MDPTSTNAWSTMRAKGPTICILGATFSTNNMGVSALAAGAIACLLRRFPDASLFFLDYAKNAGIEHFQLGDRCIPITFVNMRFSKKLYLANNIAVLLLISLALKFVPFRKLRGRLAGTNRSLQWLQNADFVVSIAGGDSFSDTYGMERFFYGVLPQALALAMGKRLVLLPQTLGPFRGVLSRLIARFILRAAEVVYSRDYAGVRNTERLLVGHHEKVRFAYDLGFCG